MEALLFVDEKGVVGDEDVREAADVDENYFSRVKFCTCISSDIHVLQPLISDIDIQLNLTNAHADSDQFPDGIIN